MHYEVSSSSNISPMYLLLDTPSTSPYAISGDLGVAGYSNCLLSKDFNPGTCQMFSVDE